MTLKQYVAAYIHEGNRARWNALPASERKRAVANVTKQLAKQKKQAKKAAKKMSTPTKAAKRYDAGSVKNFWATAGPTWGDGSPMS